MAYVDQAKKRRIAEELKKVMPKGWKYTLGVHHHSTIVLTIRSAPVDLLQFRDGTRREGYHQVNHYYLDQCYEGETLLAMKKIVKALNTDNNDRSDAMTDHFDVGHYVNLNVGRWDKAFKVEA